MRIRWVRRCEKSVVADDMKDRDRLKRYDEEVIRRDMTKFQLTEDIILERKVWRSRIKVED